MMFHAISKDNNKNPKNDYVTILYEEKKKLLRDEFEKIAFVDNNISKESVSEKVISYISFSFK